MSLQLNYNSLIVQLKYEWSCSVKLVYLINIFLSQLYNLWYCYGSNTPMNGFLVCYTQIVASKKKVTMMR